jgi:hypothetical protein
MLIKPEELSEKFYHDLPQILRANRWLHLRPPTTPEGLEALLAVLTKSDTAVYLGNSIDEGLYPLSNAMDGLACHHSAVASIEPGLLAIHASEGSPRPDWYLLCSDSTRLERARSHWDAGKKQGRR